MEKRNRKKIEELVKKRNESEQQFTEREAELWNLISPYIANAAHGPAKDIAALVEIRQMMQSIQDDYAFRTVKDALKGKDTNFVRTSGWLPAGPAQTIRVAVNQYEFHKTMLSAADDALAKYVKNYLVRRDGYRSIEMMNELIGMLPDCRARYNLMSSREFSYRQEESR